MTEQANSPDVAKLPQFKAAGSGWVCGRPGWTPAQRFQVFCDFCVNERFWMKILRIRSLNHRLVTSTRLFLHRIPRNPRSGKFPLNNCKSFEFSIHPVDQIMLYYNCIKFIKIWTRSPRNPEGTKPRNPELAAWKLAVRMHSVGICTYLREACGLDARSFVHLGIETATIDPTAKKHQIPLQKILTDRSRCNTAEWFATNQKSVWGISQFLYTL